MNFRTLYKKQTESGSNYYKLEVEIEPGKWVEARYFGNTAPKEVTDIIQRENGDYVVAIQPHTSRDKTTGRFKSYKRVLK